MLLPLTNIARLLRTYPAAVTREQAQALVDHDPDGPAALAGRLILFQCERFEAESGTIRDAGAVCAVIDPEGLTTRTYPVRVELGGRRTVVDMREWTGDLAQDPHGQANTSVAVGLEVDAERYIELWLRTLRGEL
ncbi:MAG: hypothetical protein Q4F67_13970 [Propionibacteriaceae bacterium]|nr:hypothetical protein [Propionibacteriaceae bacterium]